MPKMPEGGAQIMKEKLIKALKWFFYSYIWLGILLLVIDFVTKQIIVIIGNNKVDSTRAFAFWHEDVVALKIFKRFAFKNRPHHIISNFISLNVANQSVFA